MHRCPWAGVRLSDRVWNSLGDAYTKKGSFFPSFPLPLPAAHPSRPAQSTRLSFVLHGSFPVAVCFTGGCVYVWGFPGGTGGKEPTCQCKKHERCGFNPWVRKIPRRRAWQPTPVFSPGEPHGQRSLTGYTPWGDGESETTEVT